MTASIFIQKASTATSRVIDFFCGEIVDLQKFSTKNKGKKRRQWLACYPVTWFQASLSHQGKARITSVTVIMDLESSPLPFPSSLSCFEVMHSFSEQLPCAVQWHKQKVFLTALSLYPSMPFLNETFNIQVLVVSRTSRSSGDLFMLWSFSRVMERTSTCC